jgi:hypothetical protein
VIPEKKGFIVSAPTPPPPGWYDDPTTPGRQRWFDGTQWSDHYQSARSQPQLPEGQQLYGQPGQRPIIPNYQQPYGQPVAVAALPTARPAPSWYQKKRFLIPGGILVLAIIGSAFSDRDPTGGTPPTTARTNGSVAQQQQQDTQSAATQPATQPTQVLSTTPPVTKAPQQIIVPSGIGKNYQEAQDLWRAAGLHVLPATDATGANRIPVIDSNWVVVDQDLKPGTKVDAGSFITATVKKYTDK